MNPIGGYFEWEFPPKKNQELHEHAVYLNSGRHSLEYILRGLENIKCLWIPYFTCDVVLQPLAKLGIPHRFYKINKELEIAEEIILGNNEYLLYTNYYGIKDSYVRKIVAIYGEQLIVDNAQALYCEAVANHQFYSPRKFMGMPDGGLAVTTIPNTANELPIDQSFARCRHLLKRIELAPSEGYNDFKEVNKSIAKLPICQMSNLSKNILASANLQDFKQKRRENFDYIHNTLVATNRLQIPPMESFECPLVYPYWVCDGDVLKKKFIEKQVFVATYWPNVFEWVKQNDLEYELSNHVVCIPIDQRYGKDDMKKILDLID